MPFFWKQSILTRPFLIAIMVLQGDGDDFLSTKIITATLRKKFHPKERDKASSTGVKTVTSASPLTERNLRLVKGPF